MGVADRIAFHAPPECLAVPCSVLQGVAFCFSALQCVAMKCDYRHHTLVKAMDAANMRDGYS